MAEARSMGRGARILLYVSLLVNLLVIGLVAGTLLTGGPKGSDRRPAAAGETGLGPLVRALEPQDRQELGLKMRRMLRNERLSRGEQRALMAEIQAALTTVPYDAEALDERLDRQVEEVQYRLTLARSIFIQHISEMTDEERAAFAERLQEVLDRPRGPRSGNGPKSGD
ncbi:MAG: periplasmic heavy metal sensor [Pseudomonadota bacterium]